MKEHFEFLRVSRQNTLNLISNFDNNQLNQIPEGFNNNLIWNFGHLVVTQQLLNYGLSGLPLHIEKSLVDNYKKGTKPEGIVSNEEIESLKKLFLSCVDQTELDYQHGVFKSFKTYPTSFNATLTSIKEAIAFNNIHEGLHLGYMMAMQRSIG